MKAVRLSESATATIGRIVPHPCDDV